MMRNLKLISLLLDYPSAEVFEYAQDLIQSAKADTKMSASEQQLVVDCIEKLTSQPLIDAQSDYVAWFDRGRSLSLLMFEHVHGESRDRGQAMVDLMAVYEEHGFEIDSRELPDYLPLFLEYLSQRPQAEALQWLLDMSHILALLEVRLDERNSPYAGLLACLLSQCDANIDRQPLAEQVAGEEADNTAEAMDKIWEEEMVKFGAQSQEECGNNVLHQRRQELAQVQPLHFVDAAAK
jgi:nitrate reductase delta subunit